MSDDASSHDCPSRPAHTVPVARGDIVIVDDTPANLEVLAGVLKAQGYRVRPVPSGRLALQAAENEPPDLILLDIVMPEMDGFEVCRQLKANEALKGIPVIFLSALRDPLDKVKAFSVGGVDYVTKPFQCEEVQARVDIQFRVRRLQAELERHNRHLEESVRQRTRELEQAHERLAILDKAKSDFLNLIAHELRTPLSGILGIAELVMDSSASDPIDDEMRSLFRVARARMLAILDDALLLTRLDVANEAFRSAPVPLDEVLDAAVESAAGFAHAREVCFGPFPAADVRILGERKLLAKAVSSLLETAVKFSNPGGNVCLSCEPAPAGQVQIRVTASGRAIPDALVPRFFEVFSIADPITPGGDLGLGPPVANRIIRLFGGSVTVENLSPPGIVLRIVLRSPDGLAQQ
ncbi:MAG: hypothetical protein A3K19_11045 [Lentisphaerae bacterium RIFOXYB12_FULL_65_16]|nr:MAG: hypothetical protein A3K18_15085 [Lentisphaerae bacterium RIFOXYA12_64_32]OGV94366.1 MAG: hypothetical protein A3K19_11045 [Lentisphaerae bacterium RIFOXYB12_FULL_65_16]